MHHEANFDIDESALSLGAATLAAGAVRLLREIAEAPDTVEEVHSTKRDRIPAALRAASCRRSC
jgi:hypothetical protein